MWRDRTFSWACTWHHPQSKIMQQANCTDPYIVCQLMQVVRTGWPPWKASILVDMLHTILQLVWVWWAVCSMTSATILSVMSSMLDVWRTAWCSDLSWFSDVTWCTRVTCIQWGQSQKTNFTAPNCIYRSCYVVVPPNLRSSILPFRFDSLIRAGTLTTEYTVITFTGWDEDLECHPISWWVMWSVCTTWSSARSRAYGFDANHIVFVAAGQPGCLSLYKLYAYLLPVDDYFDVFEVDHLLLFPFSGAYLFKDTAARPHFIARTNFRPMAPALQCRYKGNKYKKVRTREFSQRFCVHCGLLLRDRVCSAGVQNDRL